MIDRTYQIWLGVLRRVRGQWLRWRGVRIGRRCWIQAIEIPRNPRDDGSTDDLSKLIDEYRDRVTFLRQENGGPGAARNRGAAAAQGEYLAFLDSDDVWFPWTLNVFDQLIREHHSPAILSAQLMEFTDEGELGNIRDEAVQAEWFSDYLASCRISHCVGAGMAVIRRDEFVKSGGFTGRRINAEDHDLILRMGIAPGFVRVHRPVTLGWRRHAGSTTMNFRKTYEGTRYLVDQELRGAYPGGAARSRERRQVVSRHLRPVVMECLQQGLRKEAWQLYGETAGWNVALGRWRFLVGFPLKAVLKRR